MCSLLKNILAYLSKSVNSLSQNLLALFWPVELRRSLAEQEPGRQAKAKERGWQSTEVGYNGREHQYALAAVGSSRKDG